MLPGRFAKEKPPIRAVGTYTVTGTDSLTYSGGTGAVTFSSYQAGQWALGSYSRFVRPGMQRVEVRGAKHDIRGLMASAFKDDRGRRVVTVYMNMGDATRPVTLTFTTATGRGGRLQ